MGNRLLIGYHRSIEFIKQNGLGMDLSISGHMFYSELQTPSQGLISKVVFKLTKSLRNSPKLMKMFVEYFYHVYFVVHIAQNETIEWCYS